jgi:hypothetical protein
MRLATCSGRRRRRQRPRTRSSKQTVAPIIDGGYNLGMPSVRLTIIVRLDQAASLGRLEHLGETRRTLIGTDVSVLLSAAAGPAATKLFSDLGAWRFRLKPLRQSAPPTTWSPATATRPAWWRRGQRHRPVWRIHLDEPTASWAQTRVRQYEWHCSFLDRVRETMSRAQV